ncbi:hypothetical protein [Streptomyces sp. NPDC048496]|uniref:hypothetical protein n=1 Tax=Streptomyces sp. NPDC048496 TaxID=3365558 RepID=UPI0037238238
MSAQTADHHSITNAITANAARSTLPYQQAHRGTDFGTAFWYNDLVDTQGDTETVRQYLVTARALTRYDIAEVRLRPERRSAVRELPEPSSPASDDPPPPSRRWWRHAR